MIYTLYYVHDPMCSWCYAFKDILNELKKHLSSNIKIVYVAGGLAAHSDEIMPKEMQNMIKNTWEKIEESTGTRFNYDFWQKNEARRSTYLSCEATLLAREENKEIEMIDAIQEAYYLKAQNPSDASTLIKLAKKIGMNEEKFEKNLESKELKEKFEKELKLRRSLGVNSFPTMILKYKKELYPINIKFDNYKTMLKQINNMVENSYF